MSQFTPDNNVLVGTIPDIQPIVLPDGNPFTTRVMQFEKMRISAAKDMHGTIDFWIALTEVADTVFKSAEVATPSLDIENPYLKDDELLSCFSAILKSLLSGFKDKKVTAEVRKVIAELEGQPVSVLLDYAKTLMGVADNGSEIKEEYLIFLMMALKIIYVKSASLAQLPKMEVEQAFHDCPMCHDAPIASVIDPMDNGLRYLVCNLCETKWHKVRATCHNCANTGRIELLSLETQESVMKAESCPECHTYIKYLDRTKNPLLDLFVEDLATLPLDFTLAEENQQRQSFNLYLR